MFSIVIPTYNRRKRLEECLGSLARQTCQDFEAVVVDDGSTDGTSDLFGAAFREPRFRYVRLPANGGAYLARNAGIDAAKGEYLVHWDSDDELYPFALERLGRCLEAHPDADIVSATADVERGGKRESFPRLGSRYVEFETYLRGEMPANVTVWAVRRSAAERVRFEAPNVDFMYFQRLVRGCRWYHLDEDLGLVHLLSDELSETRARQVPNVGKSVLRARALVPFLREQKADFLRWAPGRYGDLLYGAAVGTLLSGDRRLARTLAREICGLPARWKGRLLYAFALLPGSPALLRALFTAKRRWKSREPAGASTPGTS